MDAAPLRTSMVNFISVDFVLAFPIVRTRIATTLTNYKTPNPKSALKRQFTTSFLT